MNRCTPYERWMEILQRQTSGAIELKPTKQTEWFYICARNEGASATACQRCGAYGLARAHADRAKDYWRRVKWEAA